MVSENVTSNSTAVQSWLVGVCIHGVEPSYYMKAENSCPAFQLLTDEGKSCTIDRTIIRTPWNGTRLSLSWPEQYLDEPRANAQNCTSSRELTSFFLYIDRLLFITKPPGGGPTLAAYPRLRNRYICCSPHMETISTVCNMRTYSAMVIRGQLTCTSFTKL